MSLYSLADFLIVSGKTAQMTPASAPSPSSTRRAPRRPPGGRGGRRTCPAATPSPGPAETTTPTAERASRGETETVNTERTNSPSQKLTDRGVPKIVEEIEKTTRANMEV